MIRHDYLKIASAFFVLGIVFAYFLPPAIGRWHSFLFALLLAGILVLILSGKHSLYLLAALFFLFGVWRFALYYPLDNLELGEALAGKKIRLSGQALELNKHYEYSGSWRVKISAIDLSGEYFYPENFSIQAYLPNAYNIKVGDRLDFSCLAGLSEQKNYRGYLLKEGVYALCLRTDNLRVERKEDLNLKADFSRYASKTIDQGMAYPFSSLAKAMVLGDKSELPETVKENFSRSGLSHILAISGLHIGLWSYILIHLMFRFGLGRKTTVALVLGFIWSYVYLISWPASAWRAALMVSLFWLAFAAKRYYHNFRALLVAGAILLFFSPLAWRFDLGFGLSFLALAGIIGFYPRFVNLGMRWGVPARISSSYIYQSLLITIAAQILSWPLIAYNFSLFSFVSVLSNILVLWILPALLVFLAAGLAAGGVFFLSKIFFLAAEIILRYIDLSAAWLSDFPFAWAETKLAPLIYLCYYFVIIFMMLGKYRTRINPALTFFGYNKSEIK